MFIKFPDGHTVGGLLSAKNDPFIPISDKSRGTRVSGPVSAKNPLMFWVSAKVLDTRGTGDGVTSNSCFLPDGTPMSKPVRSGP